MTTLRVFHRLAAAALLGMTTADAWYGLLQALEKVFGQFTEQPATVAKLEDLGMEPQHSCGGALGADMDRSAKAYTQLARAFDLKAE
ncbi:hypothetical protein [Limnohabitans sp.]|jgi:hypothetical protein|uniref:hypothetical protein n=1 Tax=Limnohabitans sp. TaxID=1907725 RepID=UPI0025B9C294|nr:hypothetical protein [Limnohabitans sp.]